MIFSRHAKNKLRYLRASEEELETAMTQPHAEELGPDGKHNALLNMRGMLVRVVYVVEGGRSDSRHGVAGEQGACHL